MRTKLLAILFFFCFVPPSFAAMDFDGSDDGVLINPHYVLGSTFTLSAWIRPDVLYPNSNWMGTYTAGEWLWRISASDAYKVNFYSGYASFESTDAVLLENQWQSVAVTLTGGVYRLYHNGAIAYTSSAGQAVPKNEANLYIGRLPASGFEYDGKVDDVRIYDRALSSDEVASLHSGQNIVGDPVSHWTLRDDSTSVFVDISGTGNNGSCSNCPARSYDGPPNVGQVPPLVY